MNDIVHTLILEDNIEKAEQLVFQLQYGGFTVDYLSVDNAKTLLAALQKKDWDMILANCARPGFNGLKALRLLKQQGLRIPLITFAETLDEAEAIESIKTGAEDYISSQNQSRLVASINRIKYQSNINKVEKSNEVLTATRGGIAKKLPLGIKLPVKEGIIAQWRLPASLE